MLAEDDDYFGYETERCPEPPATEVTAKGSGEFDKESGGVKKKKKNSTWTRILPEKEDLEDVPENKESPTLAQLLASHKGTLLTKDICLIKLLRKPGDNSLSNLFKHEYYYDDVDAYFEDVERYDTTLAQSEAAIKRKNKRGSVISLTKGNYEFPFRTYKPKVQLPTAHPRAIAAADRLQRLYRKLDINILLKNLQIEYSELIPPAHYGEKNRNFSAENMWRNRSRISGVEKSKFLNPNEDKEKITTERLEDNLSDDSYSDITSEFDQSFKNNEVEHSGFGLPKSEFGPEFPLDYFDNEDFDIRSAKDWMNLCLDPTGKSRYPLPAKAFLPMPLDKSKECDISIPKATEEVLLDQSLRLMNFKKWILEQRFERMKNECMQNTTLDIDDYNIDTEVGISNLIRTGTTVKTMIRDSEKKRKDRLSSTSDEFLITDSIIELFALGGTSSESKNQLDTSTKFDLVERTSTEEFLLQFPKKIKPEDEEEEHDLSDRKSIAVSVDSDDLESFVCLSVTPPSSVEQPVTTPEEKHAAIFQGFEKAARIEAAAELGGEDGEGGIDFHTNLRRMTVRAAAVENWSSNEDLYEKSKESLVYDFNKMKKVYHHNWSWVDVAVFEYDYKKNMFLVQTIFEPIIFSWVPKIYLCMDGEDSRIHAKRIKDAIDRRNAFESMLRYNLYIDSLPMDDAPKILPELIEGIEKKLETKFQSDSKESELVLNSESIFQNENYEIVKKEVELEWMRCHVYFPFNKIIELHQKHYKTWVHGQEYHSYDSQPGEEWRIFFSRNKECRTSDLAYKKFRLMQRSALFKQEAYIAILEIIQASSEARAYRKFFITGEERTTAYELEEITDMQKMQISDTMYYLKDVWFDFIVSKVTENLGKIPRSWFNIEEQDWNVYHVLKSSKFIKLVNLFMQDTVRYMILDSLETYVQELQELTEQCMNIDKNYKWKNDLHTSEFPPPLKLKPIWLLELNYSNTGATYTRYLRAFPETVASLIDHLIESANTIPDVTPYIMTNLLFGVEKFLCPIQQNEVEIENIKKQIQALIKPALIAVDAYAQKYEYYMPLWNLDSDEYLRKWNSKDRITREIKGTVSFHKRHYAEIEAEIPKMIEIGPFRINCEPIRNALLEKKKHLYTSILDGLAAKLRKQAQDLRNDLQEIESKLKNRRSDILEVAEVREFLPQIPEILTQKAQVVEKMLKDYDLFDKFKHHVPKEDANSKWLAAIELKKLWRMSEYASTWLDRDYNELLEVQGTDLIKFEEDVTEAAKYVAELRFITDLKNPNVGKSAVINVMNKLKELASRSEILNKRQLEFNLTPIPDEFKKLQQDTEPFMFLWFTASEWANTKDAVYNHPWIKVDVSSAKKMVVSATKILQKCLESFKQEPPMLNICSEILKEIEQMRPLLSILKIFQHSGLRMRHLEAISAICGTTIEMNHKQTFNELLKQGVIHHIDEILVIGTNVSEELLIEHGLHKMEKMVSPYTVNVQMDESTETSILTPPAKVDQIVETFLKIIREYLENPYKEPFEEELKDWEKKLVTAKDTMKQIPPTQKEWIELKGQLKSYDLEKLPYDIKKVIKKMKRIWKRIARIARKNPVFTDCGSDSTMITSIAQFRALNSGMHGLIHEGITYEEEYGEYDYEEEEGEEE